MAVSKYIASVKKAAGGRPRSTEWYKDKIKEFGKPTPAQLIKDGKRGRSVMFGKLNMFYYDPKLKKKLPYYDTFPLVLPIEEYNDGFLGLNLHYLPIPLRIRLLDKLIDYANTKDLTEKTKIIADYSRLKRIKLLKPTIKRYLRSHVKSDFRRIGGDEFTIATLLPVARFKKASAQSVWSKSRKMI
tara:strand:+ start:3518 stop:4075 length:558 start_codon:yes stop_codon:yes gene_type:complete